MIISHLNTSTGSIGGTYAVPVIVVPQVVIGALGRLQTLPRYINKQGRSATSSEIERFFVAATFPNQALSNFFS